MKASVIISVYKNIETLRIVLDSLRYQTEKDFEIIISEDGNSEIMAKFVENYEWFCQYQHLSQEDLGWRKNRALNRAILSAKSEWLIFLDGDCFVHPHFVEMHLKFASSDRLLLGKRVALSLELSQKMLKGTVKVNRFNREIWKRLIIKLGCRHTDEGVYIPFCLDRPLRSVRHLIGCNMSFSKSAIIAINGFDEDYILPAVGEDADIAWRLCANGCKMVSVRNRAIVYHLYHKPNWSDRTENLKIMNRNRQNNQFVCKNGINLHLK